jgi:hypothetical protein
VTLIVSQVNYYCATQVTDRLVSYPNGSAFDSRSNKNIILRATDAIVAVAYTGVAYMGQTPIDQWIVSVLADDPELVNSQEFTFRSTIGKRQWPDLATATKRLRERITEKLQNENAFLELTITGWYQPGPHKLPRTILWSVSRNNDGSFGLSAAPRQKLYPSTLFDGEPGNVGRWCRGELVHAIKGCLLPQFVSASPAENMTRDSIRELSRRIRGNQTDPDFVEATLVDAIREISDRFGHGIGKDCIGIVLPPPWGMPCRVRYWPEAEKTHMVRAGRATLVRPVVYTPWIVGPGQILAPSVISGPGTTTFNLHGVNLEIIGPAADGSTGMLATLQHQVRPRRP